MSSLFYHRVTMDTPFRPNGVWVNNPIGERFTPLWNRAGQELGHLHPATHSARGCQSNRFLPNQSPGAFAPGGQGRRTPPKCAMYWLRRSDLPKRVCRNVNGTCGSRCKARKKTAQRRGRRDRDPACWWSCRPPEQPDSAILLRGRQPDLAIDGDHRIHDDRTGSCLVNRS